MDKNEIERRLEAAEKQMIGLQDEIHNLKAKLDEMQDEPEIPDFPEFMIGDDYYPHIRWEGTPRKSTVENLNQEYCRKPRTAEMNYFNFHSAEYYHSFENKCKLIAMMLHCKWHIDRDYVPDWGNSDESKYFVFYNNFTNGFGVTARTLSDVGIVAFSNKESARKCADWLNEHWKEDGNGTD